MAEVKEAQVKSGQSRRDIIPFVGSQVLRNRALLAVSLAVFATFVGIGMVSPVRILYAQSRGASLAVIGAMSSAYLISEFAFQYPLAWLADRWGHKQMMVVGLLGQAVLSALYIVISDPIAFVALRFLEGLAAASLLPPARALIIDIIPEEQQGEAYGIFNAFFNGGFLLGPGLGGLLAASGYTGVFVGAVLFRLVAVGIVLAMVRSGGQGRNMVEQPGVRVSYKMLFTLPLIGAYLIAFGDYLYLGFDLSLMPLWMHDHLGASVAMIGFAYMAWAVPNMLLSQLGGRIADRRSRSRVVLVCGLAQVPIYLTYGFSNMALIVVIFFAIHGIFYAFMQPAIDAHVASSSQSGSRARVQSLYSSFGLIGAFVASSGLGPLYAINFRLPLFAIGIGYGTCVVVGGLMILFAERRRMRKI